jgi:hypothetical protein
MNERKAGAETDARNARRIGDFCTCLLVRIVYRASRAGTWPASRFLAKQKIQSGDLFGQPHRAGHGGCDFDPNFTPGAGLAVNRG